MTKETLQRGLQIQDELNSLTNQLNHLNKSDSLLLRELSHPCTRKISEELQDIEDEAVKFVFKKINERIAKYQKEFKSL